MKPYITTLTRAILALAVICSFVGCSDEDLRPAAALDGNKNSKLKSFDMISPEAFVNPPLEARPGALWCWLNGTVDHERMTREMEEAKTLGMRGFEIWDIGVYRPGNMVPAGPAFLGEESLKSIKHAMTEAKRLGLELNMISASSWNAGGAGRSRGCEQAGGSAGLPVRGRVQQYPDSNTICARRNSGYGGSSVRPLAAFHLALHGQDRDRRLDRKVISPTKVMILHNELTFLTARIKILIIWKWNLLPAKNLQL